MIKLFLNFKLRVKLLLAFASIITLTILLVISFFHTLRKLDSYQLATEKVDSININILNIEKAINYFIYEGYKTESFQHEDRSAELTFYKTMFLLTIQELRTLAPSESSKQDSLTLKIGKSLSLLDKQIEQLAMLLKTRGFKDFGLEGSLREAIHTVEKSSFQYSKEDMLMLRRHEKDFFLRKDLKYQQEFNTKIESFLAVVKLNKQNETRDAILKNLEDYKNQFNELVKIDIQIGLKENGGIKGMINQQLNDLTESTQLLRASIKDNNKTFKQASIKTLTTLLIIELILGIVLAIVYSNLITKAIKELKYAIQQLADGNFPSALSVKSNEEIGKTKLAFNQLLDRIKAATGFLKAIGEGNLKATYDARFVNDFLGSSMTGMQKQLIEADEKQYALNWSNSGAAKLNDILKNEHEGTNVLTDKIIKLLVEYLCANIGALYLYHEDESGQYLSRASTYAYTKTSHTKERIEAGTGLLGQCALEKKLIVIDNPPTDYVKITSGLGMASPQCILIIPLKFQDNMMGVVELASLSKFELYQIEFLKGISETIASILYNRKLTVETNLSLSEARERAQKFAEQEDAIRRETEKMHANREQLLKERKDRDLEIKNLKEQLNRRAEIKLSNQLAQYD